MILTKNSFLKQERNEKKVENKVPGAGLGLLHSLCGALEVQLQLVQRGVEILQTRLELEQKTDK
jgi:hypothetical protein